MQIPLPDTRNGVRSEFLGLGFEKLDRDLFDPAKAYPFLPGTGVSWIRLQSGWQRTERAKGIYDFAWLDAIVDSLVGLGLKPWMCLCYGNGLYDANAAKVFGAVGVPPVFTGEQRAAWRAYVTAAVAHFRGRVAAWEVWNEPDGPWCWKHGPSGAEYGRFVAETAAAARAADPDAKILAGSMCLGVGRPWFHELAETGALDDLWGFTFHQYTDDERDVRETVRVLEAVLRPRNPRIRIVQGESGSQSRAGGNGALHEQAWTPRKQARQLLRHAAADLLAGTAFSSYFSCLDMVEALNGTAGDVSSILDYGYFGVLGAEFGPDGRATPVHVGREPAPHLGPRAFEASDLDLLFGMLRLANGARGFVYWQPAPLHTVELETTATFVWHGLAETPLLADPLAGTVEPLPDGCAERIAPGTFALRHVPVRDTPLFLLEGTPW